MIERRWDVVWSGLRKLVLAERESWTCKGDGCRLIGGGIGCEGVVSTTLRYRVAHSGIVRFDRGGRWLCLEVVVGESWPILGLAVILLERVWWVVNFVRARGTMFVKIVDM